MDSTTDTTIPRIKVRPMSRPDTRHETERQPPYAVILHNDDVNGFDFVIKTLRRVFGYGFVKSFRLTLEAHSGGRAIVWTGMLEHAEFKADQIRSCGPDPAMRAAGACPLSVSLEPLPQ